MSERQRGNPIGPEQLRASETVRKRRAELGMTRIEVCELLTDAGRDFTPNGLQKLESGERRIDLDDWAALTEVLDIRDARPLDGNTIAALDALAYLREYFRD